MAKMRAAIGIFITFVLFEAEVVAADDSNIVSQVDCLGYGMQLTLNPNSVLQPYYNASAVFIGIRNAWNGNQTENPSLSDCLRIVDPATYQLTFNYTECDLHVIRVEGLLQYIEVDMIALPLLWFIDPPTFWQNITFQVRCEYPTDVPIDAPPLTLATENPIPIATGKGQPSAFAIEFLNDHGVPIGDEPIPPNAKLTFSLALGDTTYAAILPERCIFCNKQNENDPNALKITFIDNGCPVVPTKPVIGDARRNVSWYEVEFTVFQFSKTDLELWIHCTVDVCAQVADDCVNGCWQPSLPASLIETSKIRKLSASSAVPQDVAQRIMLKVDQEGDNSDSNSNQFSHSTIYIVVGVVGGSLLLMTIVLGTFFARRARAKPKEILISNESLRIPRPSRYTPPGRRNPSEAQFSIEKSTATSATSSFSA